MANTLEVMIERTVSLLTMDGRHYTGVLKGFDQALNVLLAECSLKLWQADSAVEEQDCNVQLIRGDNVLLIGLLEHAEDLPVQAEPLRSVRTFT
jgi:U6 snRNA-associated Sm-like protein LSm8